MTKVTFKRVKPAGRRARASYDILNAGRRVGFLFCPGAMYWCVVTDAVEPKRVYTNRSIREAKRFAVEYFS